MIDIRLKRIALPAIHARTGEPIIVHTKFIDVEGVYSEVDGNYWDGYVYSILDVEFEAFEGENGVDFILDLDKALDWISNDDMFRDAMQNAVIEYQVCRAEYSNDWE